MSSLSLSLALYICVWCDCDAEKKNSIQEGILNLSKRIFLRWIEISMGYFHAKVYEQSVCKWGTSFAWIYVCSIIRQYCSSFCYRNQFRTIIRWTLDICDCSQWADINLLDHFEWIIIRFFTCNEEPLTKFRIYVCLLSSSSCLMIVENGRNESGVFLLHLTRVASYYYIYWPSYAMIWDNSHRQVVKHVAPNIDPSPNGHPLQIWLDNCWKLVTATITWSIRLLTYLRAYGVAARHKFQFSFWFSHCFPYSKLTKRNLHA